MLYNGQYLNEDDKKSFLDIQSKYPNFQMIDFYSLDTAGSDFAVSDSIKEGLDSRLYDQVISKEKLKGSNLYVKEILDLLPASAYIDLIRFMSMRLAGDLFSTDLNNKDNPNGCIFMDCDMEIKKPLGEIMAPDGFCCYTIPFSLGTVQLENGLFAVDRPNHPIIKSLLEELQIKKTCRLGF